MILKLDDFEGPLDLLLYLIKKEKMDILDIKLERITEEYLKYIEDIDSFNLDDSSSYLVMASDLMLIKSKKLLPGEETPEEEEDLINSLIEYQKYKEQLENFRILESDRLKNLDKESIYITGDKSLLKDDKERLFSILERMLKEAEEVKPEIKKKNLRVINVLDREKSIMHKLNLVKRSRFEDLFEEKDKDYIIASFLAILNLSKKKKMHLEQDKTFDTIMCEAISE